MNGRSVIEFIVGVIIILIAIAVLVSPEFAYFTAVMLVIIGIAAVLDALSRRGKS